MALKPIVEGMGLDWASQFQRVKRDEVLSTCVVVTTIQAGSQRREVTAIPLIFLNGFLFGIDTKRVRSDIRDVVSSYKLECYRVLADHWMQGAAINPRHDMDALFDLMVDQGKRSGDILLDTRKAVVEHVESSKAGVMGYVKRNVLEPVRHGGPAWADRWRLNSDP